VADNPQETVRELKDLVIAYAKQEATTPLQGMLRIVGFGVAGALLMGTGVLFLAIGILRALQSNHGWAVNGNWSWVPYVIVVALMAIVIAVSYWAARKKQSRKLERNAAS
jgi:membrane protein implicated in regulation of membrane protease activity